MKRNVGNLERLFGALGAWGCLCGVCGHSTASLAVRLAACGGLGCICSSTALA